MTKEFRQLLKDLEAADMPLELKGRLKNVVLRCEAMEVYHKMSWQFAKGEDLQAQDLKWKELLKASKMQENNGEN